MITEAQRKEWVTTMFPTTKNKFILKKLKIRRLQRLLQNREWRLKNLYIIVDHNGKKIPYEPNIFKHDWYNLQIKKGRMMMQRENII